MEKHIATWFPHKFDAYTFLWKWNENVYGPNSLWMMKAYIYLNTVYDVTIFYAIQGDNLHGHFAC